MSIEDLIDRISQNQPVTTQQKKAAIHDLRNIVESYRQGSLLQPDVQIQDLVGEMAGWLRESLDMLSQQVESGSDTLSTWERVEDCLYHLAVEIEDSTRTFWLQSGPSDSVRFNQLHHLCLLPTEPSVTRERLMFSNELRKGLAGLVIHELTAEALVAPSIDALTKLDTKISLGVFDLTPQLKELQHSLAALASSVPLYLLDQDVSDDSDWLERFSGLCSGYFRNELSRHELCQERDLFVQSFRKLSDVNPGMKVEIKLGLTMKLLFRMEEHLGSEEKLDDWLTEVRSQFESLEGEVVAGL